MALPTDLLTILAALFLLFGVPLILFSLVMLYTGYVRYDAERYIEELEESERIESDDHGSREAGSDEREVDP
ncbi:hypothetical protein [Natrarchaeobius chitinivorans]|uniref:Uncharacterized protein n=1 Tax=Natrarchaeobius chitinivorans TaxID=1679083 RepID=A0A3N6P5K5_NATCH|nr:hypothetical protein [Natrarchaeobius chitinivorans]RQG93429.1 hypothetical protein EA473_15500 [Natrarchaeobius chitinivorans]